MLLFGLAFALVPPTSALADEGQWTPEQILELPAGSLESAGLSIPRAELWRPEGGGRFAAAVNYSGCSAAFISAEGLILTNHHCAYGAIQAQSKPDRDLLAHGFLARARAEELPALGRSKILVLTRIEDVTARVKAAAASLQDPGARFAKVERVRKEIARECESAGAGLRCQVEEFYLSSRFRLFRYVELRDLRLVYAPPSSIGEYGGEIDNWMWPRHTGDFAILRAYVGPDGGTADYDAKNVPYRPESFFPISSEGVAPGAFVMIAGYPGRTHRYLPRPEVSRQVEQVLPATVARFGEWLEILGAEAARSRAVEIKVAALRKGLANRRKNAEGMLAGLRQLELLERRGREEASMRAWAQERGEPYSQVLTELEQLSEERRRTFERDLLLESAPRVSNLLGLAVDLVRRAREQKKDDLDRVEAYRERNVRDLVLANERRLRDLDLQVERAMLESILAHGDALLVESGGAPARSGPRVATTRAFVRSMLEDTTLHHPEVVKAHFEAADEGALGSSTDPMLELGMRFALALEEKEAQEGARSGRMLGLGPLFVEMLEQTREGPVYPDANGTLRFSFAKVSGYAPRDGLFATPQTTMAGALAKHSGVEPFALPKRVLDAAPRRSKSAWVDEILGDVPVCFLSDADTTGGNSGSPVLDARGRVVGLNFDRVWENIAGDFAYSPERSRNISTDIRFMLYLLDEVEHATELLAELGISRPSSRPLAETATVSLAKPTKRSDGCACSHGVSAPSAPWSLLLAGLALFAGLRPRRRCGHPWRIRCARLRRGEQLGS